MGASLALAAAVTLALLTLGCSAPMGPTPAGPVPAPGPSSSAGDRPAARAPGIVLASSPLGEEQRIVHALDRLAFGPRPADLERVRRMGLEAWIEQQLDPPAIADDAVEQSLRRYRTLTMTTGELLREFPRPDPALVRRLQSGEMSREEARRAVPPERRPGRIVAELQAAKMVRAVWSERQLQEVMVDFWFNHFNVYARKGAALWMISPYEREAIRPHALGRFRDLVLATARHPAMLFYLDNWLSTRPGLTIRRGPNAGGRVGLNENYARELLELHTLGVDGGYTQEDVVEVARCFTGWSIERPRENGRFVFRAAAHDPGDKRVLGHAIPAGGGEQDGVRVIEILTRHPSTARFVSTKLVRRFVSDEPPPALVARTAETFLRTDGDIRAVLRTIVESSEFLSEESYRAKVKKPLEVVASTVRALDGQIRPALGTVATPDGRALGGRGEAADPGLALARSVARLGEPLYGAEPPTGHPDVAASWVSSAALLGRMNFALSLTRNRIPGVRVDVRRLLEGADPRVPEAVLDRLVAGLLRGRATDQTRAVLARQLGDPEITRATADDRGRVDTDVEKLAALVLGSPEFQRR